jgi:hypothetical protein
LEEEDVTGEDEDGRREEEDVSTLRVNKTDKFKLGIMKKSTLSFQIILIIFNLYNMSTN